MTLTRKMSSIIAIWYIFVDEIDLVSTRFYFSFTLNAMSQEADKMRMPELSQQIESQFQIPDCIFF